MKQKRKIFLHKKHVTRLLYLATFGSVVLFWDKPAIAFVALALTGFALNSVTKFRLIRPYVFCAILGSLTEIVCIYAGAWSYGLPHFAGIPYWLPLVWGNASILFFELGEQFGHIQYVINVPNRKKR